MSVPLEISLQTEILFIKSLLIPAFDPDIELDDWNKRKEWMTVRAQHKKWDEVANELIERCGTISSLKEANEKKVKTERLIERAEENERQRGRSNFVLT